jgi:acetyl esterase/lipase
MDRAIFLSALAAITALSPQAMAADAKPSKTYEVEAIKDVSYYDGADRDKVKHNLDLYLPKGLKDYPVLFFVHGGAWVMGNKNDFGAYAAFGSVFAKLGIGVVVTNYRLSPAVTHPGHVKDVARAFAWTAKNIAKHGGNKDRIFLCGHSAGAHLVALLATDATYLKAHDLTSKAIRGVVPISGPFILAPGFMPKVFGDDKKAAPAAAPFTHVRKGLPPFLIVFADNDFVGCDKRPAEAFCKALKDKGNVADTLEIKDHNHITVLMSAGMPAGKAHQEIVKFIREHSAK